MSARANVVLPAPRSPESVTTSPGWSAFAMSIARRLVACSSGMTTVRLDVAGAVGGVIRGIAMAAMISCRRLLGAMLEREHAGHRGAAADRRFERHGAAMQLHEGA